MCVSENSSIFFCHAMTNQLKQRAMWRDQKITVVFFWLLGIRFGAGIEQFNFNVDDGSCAMEWKIWLRGFELFVKANKIGDDEKHNWLLHFAGAKVQSVFYGLPPLPTDNEHEQQRGPLANGFAPFITAEYDEIVAKLDNFFAPKRNAAFERHVFRLMKQKERERIDVFAMRLRAQAEKCDFEGQIDDNIKEQITAGCSSVWLREKILENGSSSLDEIIKRARIHEMVAVQKKSFTAVNDENINPNNSEVCKIFDRERSNRPMNKKKFWGSNRNIVCSRCGFSGHKSADLKCPARGKICRKCNGKDHFARRCFGRKTNGQSNAANAPLNEKAATRERDDDGGLVHLVENHKTVMDDYDDVFCIATAEDSNEIWCQIGGVEVKVIVDSGSKYNIVDRDTWAELKVKNIQTISRGKEVDKKFRAYGGKELKLLGVFKAEIKVGQKKAIGEFFVVDETGKILLGRDTATLIKILKIDYDVNQIDQSVKLNKIKGVVVEIPLKEGVAGVVQRYRRVPAPLEKKVDEKIESLLKQGVIEKVNGPSKWVSPLVPVPKQDGDIRICVDMKRANQAVERENHPLPTMENLLPHLGTAKLFSKLDIKQAYHQV